MDQDFDYGAAFGCDIDGSVPRKTPTETKLRVSLSYEGELLDTFVVTFPVGTVPTSDKHPGVQLAEDVRAALEDKFETSDEEN